uniref:NXPE family member 3-like n=1 Tax=Monopterus albus TaxID=43700 RepID=UPI0009B3A8E1
MWSGLSENSGSLSFQVKLVHPSEAITVLRRLNREQPDRVHFKTLFQSGSVSETTACNWCLRPNQQPLCNYTDAHTGEPWFCYKPKNLSCNTRIKYVMGGFIKNLKANEEKLFQSDVNMKVPIRASGPAAVTVLPNKTGQPEMNKNDVTFTPSGYYYQGVWRALGGTTIRQFSTSTISQCLKGKMVHLYGDSTVRQWFEYLTNTLPDLKEFNLYRKNLFGPLLALDLANDIMVTFRCHSSPIIFHTIPFAQVRYIANEIDGITGGTDTVVVVSVWAHFCPFPIEMYIRRMQNIRKAVVRLLERAPGTLVIIRT